jgi:hypothetical protein
VEVETDEPDKRYWALDEIDPVTMEKMNANLYEFGPATVLPDAQGSDTYTQVNEAVPAPRYHKRTWTFGRTFPRAKSIYDETKYWKKGEDEKPHVYVRTIKV